MKFDLFYFASIPNFISSWNMGEKRKASKETNGLLGLADYHIAVTIQNQLEQAAQCHVHVQRYAFIHLSHLIQEPVWLTSFFTYILLSALAVSQRLIECLVST